MKYFTKTQVADIEYEWLRTCWLYEVSRMSGSFLAPKPVHYSMTPPTLIMTHLPPGRSLKNLLRVNSFWNIGHVSLIESFQRAGKGLSDLHQSVVGPGTLPAQIFEKLISFRDEDCHPVRSLCPMHGDFWVGNIWIDHGGGAWFFDPIPEQLSSEKDCWRIEPAFDLASMLISARMLHPLWALPFINERLVTACLHAFLEAYETSFISPIDRHNIMKICLTLLNRYRMSVNGRLGNRHAAFRLQYVNRSHDIVKSVLFDE